MILLAGLATGRKGPWECSQQIKHSHHSPRDERLGTSQQDDTKKKALEIELLLQNKCD
jgi:hypothetical protein